jgi:hypothetical protein
MRSIKRSNLIAAFVLSCTALAVSASSSVAAPTTIPAAVPAVTSAPTARACTFGPSYDTYSQHATGVTVTFYSYMTWGLIPKMNVVAKAARYRFDYRSRWVALNAQIKLGSSWKSVALDNTYRFVGSVPAGTSFGTSGGWFKDNAQSNADWYSRVC